MKTKACSGIGGTWHKAGHQQYPAYNQIYTYSTATKLVILQKHATASREYTVGSIVSVNTTTHRASPSAQNYSIYFHRHREITVLPDSGADTSAAGNDIMNFLGNHPDNLLPSVVTHQVSQWTAYDTSWIHYSHVAIGPTRITYILCVDLSKLNKYVIQERYMSPTPAEAVADIAAQEAKYFTVINAMKGY